MNPCATRGSQGHTCTHKWRVVTLASAPTECPVWSEPHEEMFPMKKSLFTRPRARSIEAPEALRTALRAAGVRHCGELRFDPAAPSCRFCGEDCGGVCG